MKKILIILLISTSVCCRAQDVAGYWYGSANVVNSGSTNNYLIELIVKQNNTSVQAIINYYFRNTYRSLQFNGNYNPKTRQLELYNIPVPYFGSSDQMQVDCQMDFIATHRVAKAGSNLVGRFVGREGYRYTCPELAFDLRLNQDAGNQDSVLVALRNFKESYQLWSPSARDTFVAATVIQRPIQNIVVNNEFAQRKTEVQNEIVVSTDSIQVDLYDNGEVDGDSISIFFNDKLLGSNLRLSTRSIHLNIALDTTKEINELSMFANNLGSIPPNTALMLVSDGKKRYEVRLSSNFEKNAAVRIRRKKNL
jgi:hypothetical protein